MYIEAISLTCRKQEPSAESANGALFDVVAEGTITMAGGKIYQVQAVKVQWPNEYHDSRDPAYQEFRTILAVVQRALLLKMPPVYPPLPSSKSKKSRTKEKPR